MLDEAACRARLLQLQRCRLPAHALLQHSVNVVHLVLGGEHLLLEPSELQQHEGQAALRAHATATSRAITCSPIMSHFRLKNASHSSVGFFAKYLGGVTLPARAALAAATHPVPISTIGVFTFSSAPRT